MFKKISGVLMATILGFTSLGVLSANAATNSTTSETSEECTSCTDALGGTLDDAIQKLADEGTTTNLDVSKTEKKEIKSIVNEKDKQYTNELNQLNDEKLSQIEKADNFIIFKNLKENDVTYKKIAVYTAFYVNEDTNKVAKKQVWVNLDKKEVQSYILFKMNSDGSDVQQLVAFDKSETQSNQMMTTMSKKSTFHIGDTTFYCSLSGIVACAAAFGGLEVVLPELGAATSLACSTAFIIFCP